MLVLLHLRRIKVILLQVPLYSPLSCCQPGIPTNMPLPSPQKTTTTQQHTPHVCKPPITETSHPPRLIGVHHYCCLFHKPPLAQPPLSYPPTLPPSPGKLYHYKLLFSQNSTTIVLLMEMSLLCTCNSVLTSCEVCLTVGLLAVCRCAAV